MRNLKKILALALALVMTLSVMSVANATFTDSKDFTEAYNEAATVLTNLGVLKGYTDGSFQPKGEITRAEVAAIVYRIVTGDVNDKSVGIYADYAKFDDVKSTAWYAGYVGYCNNAELIKGYGNGKFGPNDKVTGYQALAMILRAMGYDKNGEFTGTGWEVKVASTAQQRGILVNINQGTLGVSATRELVAEIIFQAITKNTVVYTPALGYYTADAFDGIATTSLGYKTFGLTKVSGEVTAVSNSKGTTTLTPVSTVNGNDNALNTAKAVVVAETDADFGKIGYVSYVWAVKTPAAKTYTAVSDVTPIGQSLKVTTNGTALDKSKVTVEDNARYYLNGVVVEKGRIEAIDELVGVKIDYIDNDNGGKAEVVVATQYKVATVTGIATDINAGINATQPKSYYLNHQAVEVAHLITADTLAYNDLVTFVYYSTEKDFYVTKVPYTTGLFTQLYRSLVLNTNDYNYAYTIGGTDYYKASAYQNTTSDVLVQANLQKNVVIGTDPYGYILTASLYTDPNAYLYVVENEQTKQLTALTETSVVFADGTTSVVNVNGLVKADGKTQTFFSASSDNIWNSNDIDAHIYAYTVKDGVYTLYNVGCADTTVASYVAGSAQFGTLGIDQNTVIVDLRPGKVGTVYTGHTGDSQVPGLTNAKVHYLAPVGGRITLGYLVSGSNSADLSADFIAYKTSVNTVLGSAVTGYTYLVDLLVNGELKTNCEITQAQYDALSTYGVGHYQFASDGTLTFTAFPEKWVDATWANSTVTIGGSTYYPYGTVPFYVINVGKEAAVPYTMTAGFDGLLTSTNNTAKAYITYNANGTVKAIYVIDDHTNLATTTRTAATMVKNNKVITYKVDSKKITTPDSTVANNWEAQAKALVDVTTSGDTTTYTPKAGVTTEQLDALLAKVEAALKNTNITLAEYNDASAAKTILEGAKKGSTSLEKTRTDALDALDKTYNKLTQAEQTNGGSAAYQAARAAISAATTLDGIDKALAEGIAKVSGNDADNNSLENLASELKTANVSLDQQVAVLRTKENNVQKIGAAIWKADSSNGDPKVIPALINNDVSVEKIYTDYLASGKSVSEITTALKGSTATNEEILEGYAAYLIPANGSITGWSNITVAYNAATNTATLTVKSGASVTTGSGVGDVLAALGITTVSWTAKCNDKTYPHTNETVGAFKADIVAILGKLSEGTWSVTATIDGVNYTINFAV